MYEYKVKDIIRVIDGDTVEIIVDLGFDVYKKATIRLWGINTPEIRTRDPEEKAKGILAKNFTINAFENSLNITITTKKDKTGSFNRMLGTFIVDGVNLNELLVLSGHALRFKP